MVASRGGGVLIAIKKSLHGKTLPSVYDDLYSFDQQFVILPTHKIIIGSIYIPPASNISSFQEHIMHVEDIRNTFLDHQMILMGDYNLPRVIWSASTSGASHRFGVDCAPSSATCAAALIDNFASLGLYQHNLFSNSKGNILDLCFCSVNASVNLSNDILSKIDEFHPVLSVSLPLTLCADLASGSFSSLSARWDRYNFRRCNFEIFNHRLSMIKWRDTLGDLNLSAAVEKFYSVINDLVADIVPLNHCDSAGYPPWFSNKLISLLIRKKLAHKNYKINQCESEYITFKDLRSLCKAEASACYSRFISNIEDNLSSNMNIFWHFINNKRGTQGYPTNMYLDDKNGQDSVQVATLFADFFSEVYGLATANTIYCPATIATNCSKISVIDDHRGIFSVSEEEIVSAIRDLKPSFSLGADGIPAFLIKGCSFSLVEPLHILFNLSLFECSLPDLWKKTYITPIFKKGSRNDIRNYRPIAIISAIPKLLDRIMYNKTLLLCSHIISNKQHGFVPSRSTITNLALFTNRIFSSFSRNRQLDAVYLDFRKAFDLINHKILLLKLKHYNLPIKFIHWIESYLTGRFSCVRINNAISHEFLAPSGVPQGSHLGPLLFLLFINDLALVDIYGDLLLFADDIKLFLEVGTANDCVWLQSDLLRIIKWCEENLFFLNFEKCFTITFSRRENFIPFNYLINNVSSCIRVSSIKDLGVIFDTKLSFGEHITSVIGRANRMWGFIIRNTKLFTNTNSIRLLYLTLVRSVLMYASTIWRSNLKFNIERLERVQHKVLRHLAYRSGNPMHGFDHDYTTVSRTYGLPTILSSMVASDNLFTFKVISNLINCEELKSLLPLSEPRYTLRHNQPFYPIVPITRYAENNPIFRLCVCFNDLSCKVSILNLTSNPSGAPKVIKAYTHSYA